jgi:RNA polymerase sigma-70 factor (ECF subfamily)
MSGTSSPLSAGSTSSSLIRRAALRDPQAWARLVDLYGPLVFYWCRRHGLVPPDAADVVQDVFTAVSGALERFEHGREGSTFRGWLRVIAQNKIRDHYRRRAGEPLAAGGTDAAARLADIPDARSDSSSGASEQRALSALYHRALDLVRSEFEQRTWQAFWRTVVEGHDTAEVAADLGLTTNTVRQYKSRVLRRLREELGE